MSYKTVEDLIRRVAEGASNREIARALDKSDSWVSLYLKAYREACPQLHAAWDEEAVTDEVAMAVAGLPMDRQPAVLQRILALPNREGKFSRGMARKIVYAEKRANRGGVP